MSVRAAGSYIYHLTFKELKEEPMRQHSKEALQTFIFG
jgi:hypothetical protein